MRAGPTGTGAPSPVTVDAPARGIVLRGLLADRTMLIGAVLVAIFALMVLAGPFAAPHDPNAVDVANALASPSAQHPFGTDNLGRDILSRVLSGARVSVGSTIEATMAISVIGLVVGMIAGYAGGALDAAIMWVVNILLGFPYFLLALAVAGILGPSLTNVVVAIIAVWWPSYARIARGAVLAEREKAYVDAARGMGASHSRMLGRHLLPNIVAPIVVLTTLDMGAVLLSISGLSFLGLGVRPPTAEWGAMLSEGKNYISITPNLMLFPGAAIFLLVLGFNLLGDGLRDLLDPRTRGRG